MMELNESPRLTITAIRGGQSTGSFDPSPGMGENWIGCVIASQERFIWGRFHHIDTVANTCVFRPDDVAHLPHLEVGCVYRYLDGHWGKRAELVLDRERRWHRARFEARDAIQFKLAGDGLATTEATEENRSRGKIVKEGWYHEHCAICWEKLGHGGQAEGFLSPPKTWVCEACYVGFVEPRSLGFIRETR